MCLNGCSIRAFRRLALVGFGCILYISKVSMPSAAQLCFLDGTAEARVVREHAFVGVVLVKGMLMSADKHETS